MTDEAAQSPMIADFPCDIVGTVCRLLLLTILFFSGDSFPLSRGRPEKKIGRDLDPGRLIRPRKGKGHRKWKLYPDYRVLHEAIFSVDSKPARQTAKAAAAHGTATKGSSSLASVQTRLTHEPFCS